MTSAICCGNEPDADLVFLEAVGISPRDVAQLVHSIRREPATTGIPIIVATDLEVRVLVESGIRLSPDDHIVRSSAYPVATTRGSG